MHPKSQAEYRGHAIAALKAMKEHGLTKDMARAGTLRIQAYEDEYDLKVVMDFRAQAGWDAMLQAAIDEQEKAND
jgi:hypothetical protein